VCKDKQIMFSEKIAINGLSVRATEAVVKDETGANTKKRTGISTARSKKEKLVVHDPEPDRLETELADSLGA